MFVFLRGTSLTLLIVSVYGPALHAQTNNPKYQFGVGAGIFIYQGDLTPSALGSYRTMRPVIGLSGSRLFSPSLALRANLALGGLHGEDARYSEPAYRQQRNFAFRTPVAEASLLAEWNILGRQYLTRGFAPYVFGGAGASLLRVRRDYSRMNSEVFSAESTVATGLAQDLQHRTPRLLPVLPVGAGVRYYFNDRIGIGVESGYRFARTDYLDGFSKSANPSKRDFYYSHTVQFIYRVGKKNMLDCPVIRY